MTSPRIVALLPSATEIVAALGFHSELVGRSHECDFPPGIERLPVCTAPRLASDRSTEEIHRSVQDLLAESLSVYRVHADRLRELEPTHVVTQVQCAVCAVSLPDVERALSDWASPRPELVALESASLPGVFLDIERVAGSLEAPERGRALVEHLRARMTSVAKRARGAASRPRVATVEWLRPLMAAGNWMPEIVEMAGGENLFGTSGKHSPWLEWEALRAADPEVLILFPCGFSLPRLEQEVGLLMELEGFGDLAAARSGRVFLADGNQLFNRPGPRLVETLEVVAEMLHPERFRFGHEEVSWRRLEPSESLPRRLARAARRMPH
jgi:iron complex transport system substrate-binding protein